LRRPEKISRIVNKSGQALQGGSFKLSYDQADGTRTPIVPANVTTTYADTLADNETIEAEFPTPTGAITSYTLFYRGTIGASGTTALDQIEKDIAIAATQITCVEGPGDLIPYNSFASIVCQSASISVLRVKDFSLLVPKLVPCESCLVNSPFPAWNGEIPINPDFYLNCFNYLIWETDEYPSGNFITSLNGATVAATITSGPTPAGEGVGWRLAIGCKTPGGGYSTIWAAGTRPEGTHRAERTFPMLQVTPDVPRHRCPASLLNSGL